MSTKKQVQRVKNEDITTPELEPQTTSVFPTATATSAITSAPKKVRKSSPKSNVAKMILARIVASQQESIDLNQGDIWLEHIMPQKPKGSWLVLKEADSELYEFSVDRLGNLTLLQNKLNQGASNKDFAVKQKEYQTLYDWLKAEYPDSYISSDHWTNRLVKPLKICFTNDADATAFLLRWS